MKNYVTALILLVASVGFSAGNLEKFNINVKADGDALVITAEGEGQLPDIMGTVNKLLDHYIRTTMYQPNIYNPKLNYSGYMRGNIYVSTVSITLPDFFNAKLVKQAGNVEAWINVIKKALD